MISISALMPSTIPAIRTAARNLSAPSKIMANLATRAGVEGNGLYTIHTPLIQLSKAEIIRTGLDLGVDYKLTHSCYDPTPAGVACGRCDSCLLRLKGFSEAGSKIR